MGQLIAVTEKPSPNAGLRRFEANRSLTGMGHEVFTSAADAIGPRPAAKLARDLLATGEVTGVRVYGNMITVDLKSGSSGAGLDAVVRDLYQYWKPGMEMPTFDDVVADAPAAAAAPAGGWGHRPRGRLPGPRAGRARRAQPCGHGQVEGQPLT
jgi:hypothetical protein